MHFLMRTFNLFKFLKFLKLTKTVIIKNFKIITKKLQNLNKPPKKYYALRIFKSKVIAKKNNR